MKNAPKRSRRQRLTALLACVLALLLLLPMVMTVVGSLSAMGASVGDIQSKINALKGKNKDLASQRSNLKSELKSIQADKNEAVNKRKNLEQQINYLQEEIDNLTAQMEQYAALIVEKEQEVADNEAREAAQFALFQKQCRAMEKEGTVTYWSILFAADSFADLLDKVNTINAIADYNQGVCDQLQAAREALQQAKAELETAKAETEAAKAQRESAQTELEGQKGEVQALIKEIAADEKATQAEIDKLDKAAKEQDAEIQRLDRELQKAIEEARRNASNQFQFDPGSGFYWPLPKERVSVTSFFGPRTHPISGKYHNHSGTDIGAYSGTEIYAAHGGIVLTSAYHSSYGNYVVLSRGDGITTLYAHMSKRAVKVGDVVSQGQVIGYVGSTGSSTAPHLHFEVRVNGVRQDALKYYPNVKWKNNTGFPYE